MRIHPAIAALRADPEAQRLMQKDFLDVLGAWEKQTHTKSLEEELAAFGAGKPLEELALLDGLMADHCAASTFVQIWQRSVIAAARRYPLGSPNCSQKYAAGVSQIELMASGRATLSVTAYEQREEIEWPRSVVFTDQDTYECVLSGAANGLMHEVRQWDGLDTVIDTCATHWRKGAILVTKGPCETRQVVSVEGAMVLLQLSLKAPAPQPMREFSLDDGALIRMGSGTKSVSERLLAISTLGAMEATGALDAMELCAFNADEDIEVRWEAVRQTVSLDLERGFALLQLLAAGEADALREPARELLTALQDPRSDQRRPSGAVA